MSSWRSWLNLVRSLKPSDRIKLFARLGCIHIFFSLALTLNLHEEEIISDETFARVPAWLSSRGETWKPDRSLYSFKVKYQTPDGHRQNTQSYAEKIYYDAADLDIGAPLYVELIKTEKGSVIKRISTTNGMFIYDPILKSRITQALNQQTIELIALLAILGLTSLFIAAVFNYRLNRT